MHPEVATMGVDEVDEVDAVVVGAGFAGMYMLYRLRELGLTSVVVEAGSGVGGTWYWNRYPGARCDIPSLDYSYSFSEELQQEWVWTERYATQPEIERYANHVADRFDLRRDILLDTAVVAATFERSTSRWAIETDGPRSFRSRFLIMATGGYSVPVEPEIAGIQDFKGEIHFTAKWPSQTPDFDGKRVGVLGTGSSGMQTATAIAKQKVEHLYVFQRTPNFAAPAQNRPLSDDYQRAFKKSYSAHRAAARYTRAGVAYPIFTDRSALDYTDAEFDQLMDAAWAEGGGAVLTLFPDLLTDERANERVADYIRRTIRARVADPCIAEKLAPTTHFVGARRLLVEIDYFEIFNQSNVSLVDLNDSPLESVSVDGIVTTQAEYPLDVLVLATGFDSGTGAMLRVAMSESSGLSLADHWSDGPRTYLGLMVHGFPNMFMIAGPGSPSIRSHMMVSIEQHVEWVTDLLRHALDLGAHSIEPTQECEEAWTNHVADVAASTLFTHNDTQYWGTNVPGKPRVYTSYLGGVGGYRQICDAVRAEGYAGLVLNGPDQTLSDNAWDPGEEPWNTLGLGRSAL
jgi:cation diffusion facilitator CzcD-associated flavoprotein CzcO